MRTILPLTKTCANFRIALLVALLLLGGVAHKVQNHADLGPADPPVCHQPCQGVS